MLFPRHLSSRYRPQASHDLSVVAVANRHSDSCALSLRLFPVDERFRNRQLARLWTHASEMGRPLRPEGMEEPAMPHYVTLVRYTSQGISKIKDSPSRLDAARKAAEAEGGKIQTWYLTMGQYDAVLISEFPSDEACAKFTLSASALGNISTETLKAFPEADYRKIIGSLR